MGNVVGQLMTKMMTRANRRMVSATERRDSDLCVNTKFCTMGQLTVVVNRSSSPRCAKIDEEFKNTLHEFVRGSNII